ncbi:hypothetical protein A1O3_06931 [Capronia epimyces CBS 606.96]|uniref:Amino acid permease/ SLC12A domain-containing protein n=1 Tax=Capronia epimyces CBS 606.96 TaxID=1182542 RepID=W9XJF3_9EURO|nr:uncharacterized protein A1O3_06931 [Capronia epimyces CBS 606.96]EXJ80647.1 hypothetical protein A1O3_06931 [Capronia epimyces CBS 606.96]
MILGMAKLYNENYVLKDWHIWLCYVAVIWTACALVIFGSRILPAFNHFMMYFSFAALIVTFVTLLACAAPNYRSTSWVFATTSNATGVDAGAHMCEEIPNPTVNVPKVIVRALCPSPIYLIDKCKWLITHQIYPVIIGFFCTFPFSIACMYVMTDLDAVLNTDTGLPLMELYLQATGSKAATVALMSAFAICMFGAACANITSSSRQMWAASRDNCFPFSKYWSQLHPRRQMPLNVVCVTGTLTCFEVEADSDGDGDAELQLYGLIFLGSSTVFASMVGASIVFMTTSYVIPQGILAWRGRDAILPERPFGLGAWGLPVNMISCIWVAGIDVLFCFPTAMPVTKNNMSWISVVIVALCLYILIAWNVWQKKVFKGPGGDLPAMRLQRLGAEAEAPHTRFTLLDGSSIPMDETPAETLAGKENVAGRKRASS